MASEEEYQKAHESIRAGYQRAVVDGFKAMKKNGSKTEDIVIALIHTSEALCPEEERQSLRMQGRDVAVLAVDRKSFVESIFDFEHPETRANCYAELAEYLAEPLENHFHIVVFHSMVSTATPVLVKSH